MDAKHKEALAVVERLATEGFEAYFAGGSVRDKIMGLNPLDYDIATNARPEQVAEIFEKSVLVGARFGVVRVICNAGEYEVATFRNDFSYIDGRRPEKIAFTTKEEDVARRDFTINGMLLNPATGEILDLVGGREDIKNRLIKTIGDPEARFTEDSLRLIRAIRFAARLGFEIEEKTFLAIKKHAPDISRVSAERLYTELTRILTEGAARRGFELLNETGLLDVVLPEVAKMKGVEQPPQFHPEGDVWVHTLLLLQELKQNESPELAWAALLHDVGKPDTFVNAPDRIRFDNHDKVGVEIADKILKRLKAGNKLTQTACELIADHLKFMNAMKMRPARLKRFLWRDTFDLHMRLHWLDCNASHKDFTIYDFCLEKIDEFAEERLKTGLTPLVNGRDLIELGVEKGPVFSEIIEAALDMQLEQKIKTKAEAVNWVSENYIKK